MWSLLSAQSLNIGRWLASETAKTDKPTRGGEETLANRAKISLEKHLASLQPPDKWAFKVTKLRAWSQPFHPGKGSRQAFSWPTKGICKSEKSKKGAQKWFGL